MEPVAVGLECWRVWWWWWWCILEDWSLLMALCGVCVHLSHCLWLRLESMLTAEGVLLLTPPPSAAGLASAASELATPPESDVCPESLGLF